MANIRERLFTASRSGRDLRVVRRRRALALEGLEARIVLSQLVPSLSGGGNAIDARSGGTPVVVNPNLTINDPANTNLTSASISIDNNFTPAEDQLLFTNQNGIVGTYNAASGLLSLSGSATAQQYQAALDSVEYQDTNTDPSTANRAPRSVNFSIAPGAYNPANGHFYVYVAAPGGSISWTDAKAAADASTLDGLQGYLATLTSASEDAFAYSRTETNAWIGGSDSGHPGYWAWADGPETGLQFWLNPVVNGVAQAGGTPIAGVYENWATGQPDDVHGIQDYTRFLGPGTWDDLENTFAVPGYLVEYGGSANDPTLQVTAMTTVNVGSTTNTPVVSSPTTATLTNSATATITGTADSGSLVQVFNSDGTVAASLPLAVGQTSFSISTPLAANLANNFYVTATDGASSANPADPSAKVSVITITNDSIAPAVPTITQPMTSISVSSATSVITGTAEAGSLVELYNDANDDGKVDDGEVVVAKVQLDPGVSSFSFTATLAMNAPNRFLVTAEDAATNVSGPAVAPTITQDSIAPVGPSIITPSKAVIVNATTYDVTGTAEAGSLVRIYLDANHDGSPDSTTNNVEMVQLAAGQTSFSIAVPLTDNSANDFLATATDAAGNQSGFVVVPTITTDSIAPVAVIITSPLQPVTVNTTDYTITGTAEAGSLVQIYGDTNGDGMIDGGEVVVGTDQLAVGQTTFSIVVPLAANLDDHFLATATDAAGNASSVTVVPTITEDSIAPAPVVITSPSAPLTVNATTYPITGTAEAGSLVQIYGDTNGDGMIDGGEVVVGTDQLAAGQTTFSIIVPLVANTQNNFLATATDAAGNASTVAVVPTISEDSLPPAAPTITTPSSAVTVDTTTTSIVGSAEAGSLVKLYADLNGDGMIDDGEEVIDTDQLSGDIGLFIFSVSLNTNAPNYYLVTATDAVGNTSAVAVVPTITQTVPVVTPPSPLLPVHGTVYLDLNSNGTFNTGEPGVAGRVLYIDTNDSGSYVSGDPTATTDADGNFTFTGTTVSSAPIREYLSQDTSDRYAVAQTTLNADAEGAVLIGIVPYSPIFAVPVVPNPTTSNTGATANALYVQGLYKAVLGRVGADSEIAGWTTLMTSGMSAGTVASLITNSLEHRTDQVTEYYQAFFDRGLDPYASYWIDELMSGVSEEQVVESLLNSGEYQSAHTDSDTFVQDLYLDVLGRQGEASGITGWESDLAAGASRNYIVAKFVESAEANDQIIESLYTADLHRPREAGTSAIWSLLLADGASPSLVAAGILSSAEFQSETDDSGITIVPDTSISD